MATTKRKRARVSKRGAAKLEDLMNVGPSIADDLRLIGIRHPDDLVGKDPYVLYETLCQRTGVRHDPCVIDTFISVVRFMEGAPARPWWHYTDERKRRYERH